MGRRLTKLIRYLKPDKPYKLRGLWILLIPLTVERRLRRRFYDGPAVYNYPGRKMKGYRSPNVLLGIWLHAITMGSLTPFGRVLFAIAAVFFVFGLVSLEMPAYYLSFGITALFLVDILIGWWYRPKTRLNRDHTTLAEVGSTIRLDYDVENTGKRPVWDLMVDILPVKHGEAPEGISEVPSLLPGDRVELSHEIVIKRRGQHDLPMPISSSSFPFGLWRWGSRGRATPPVNIYPAFTPLESLNFPLGREGQQGKELMASRAHESNEFMGCREYRYGDNPKLIHAQSWARLGQPVVKEFREEYLPHAAMFIDNFCRKPSYWSWARGKTDQELEAALTISAAIADKLTRQNYLIDVFVPGWELTHIREKHGPDQLDAILELTAAVEPNRDDDFHSPQQEQMARIEELQNLLLVLLDWDEPRQTFVRELLERNVGIKIVLISAQQAELVASEELVKLPPDDVLAGEIINL